MDKDISRRDVLDRAAHAVSIDRNSTYGEPEDSFAPVALIWAALDDARGDRPRGLVDVALYLAALKLVRAAANPAHADSWVDLAGYAACGGEIACGSVRGGSPFLEPYE